MTLRAVPDTHWARLMVKAREDFANGDGNAGLANVVNAAYVAAVKDEAVDPDEALRLTRELLGVSWSPDQDGAA